jgi:NADH-quinone oxidoreductase subunit L
MASIGAVTSLYGSFVSFIQYDIKKLCAYSTISHLGLIFLSIAIGNISYVFFHLFVHACCKAILFICVGVYQHVTHSQDIRQIRGIG